MYFLKITAMAVEMLKHNKNTPEKTVELWKLQQSAYWLQFPKATIQLQFFLLLVIFKEIMSLNPQNKRWMILIQGLTK